MILWLTFRDVRPGAVTMLLSGTGAAAVLVLLPHIAALSAETAGWRWAFAVLGRRVPYLPLLEVRVATEALSQSLPAGAVWCESVKPYLLGRHCGVTVAESIAGMAARKYLLLVSQAAFLFITFVVGFRTTAAISSRVLGSSGLEWVPLAAGSALSLAAAAVAATLQHGSLAARVHTALRKLPIEAWRRLLDRQRGSFSETDEEVARYFARGRLRATAPAVAFLIGWVIEAFETFLILRLLGVQLDFFTVASFEVLVVLLRHVVFVVPAGLGVQELGYLTFLSAHGVPDALSTGAAFALLKRAKELVWAVVGYGLLLLDRGSSVGARPLGADSA